MPLRFVRLSRPEIRKLQAGERITEHGITAEGLVNGAGSSWYVPGSTRIVSPGEAPSMAAWIESPGWTRWTAALAAVLTAVAAAKMAIPSNLQERRRFIFVLQVRRLAAFGFQTRSEAQLPRNILFTWMGLECQFQMRGEPRERPARYRRAHLPMGLDCLRFTGSPTIPRAGGLTGGRHTPYADLLLIIIKRQASEAMDPLPPERL